MILTPLEIKRQILSYALEGRFWCIPLGLYVYCLKHWPECQKVPRDGDPGLQTKHVVTGLFGYAD